MPDSPDNATRQNDHIRFVGQIRSFGNLVDPSRCVQFHGVVDDPSVISETLAKEATKKTFKLLVTVRQIERSNNTKRYECQVGLIREGMLNDYIVRPVTAKHNVANGEVEGVVERFRLAELRVPKTVIERYAWILQTVGARMRIITNMRHCMGGPSLERTARATCCLLPTCSK
jgi:hypothetical protein